MNAARRDCLKGIGLAVAALAEQHVWLGSLLALEAAPESVPNEAEQAEMAEIAGLFMSRNNVKGLSVAIARHGQFVYRKAFGVSDESSGDSLTQSMMFRIGSVSKPITSVALFSLIQTGCIRLNDFVFGSEGILRFDYGDTYPQRVRKITVDHLLHTHAGVGETKRTILCF